MQEENKYTKKLQPRKIIKCPHCNYEYLPCEVLYPDQVLCKVNTRSIVRDPLGHILYEENLPECDPLAEDKFICDNCGKPFIIEIETNFKAKPEVSELDFSDTVTSLW